MFTIAEVIKLLTRIFAKANKRFPRGLEGVDIRLKAKKIYDVACSDGLEVDPLTQRCPDNGAKVNLTNCAISNDKGASELKSVWTDPDFEPGVEAFYYVRVLENPTCRWTTWDAIRTGNEIRPGLDITIQERAWSSPIWYKINKLF